MGPEGLQAPPVRQVPQPAEPAKEFLFVDLAGHRGPHDAMLLEEVDRLTDFGHAHLAVDIGQRLQRLFSMVPDGENGHPTTTAMNRLSGGNWEPTPAGQNTNQFTVE